MDEPIPFMSLCSAERLYRTYLKDKRKMMHQSNKCPASHATNDLVFRFGGNNDIRRCGACALRFFRELTSSFFITDEETTTGRARAAAESVSFPSPVVLPFMEVAQTYFLWKSLMSNYGEKTRQLLLRKGGGASNLMLNCTY